jgi:hypothetical protein
MSKQLTNAKSASSLGEGERIKVNGFCTAPQQDNLHPALSLEKGEAAHYTVGTRSSRDFDHT